MRTNRFLDVRRWAFHTSRGTLFGCPVMSAVCVFHVLGCQSTEKARDVRVTEEPLEWSVLDSGPLNVGHRSFFAEYEDPTGLSVTLPVDVWYPTEDDDGDASMYYDIVQDDLAFSEASLAAPVHTDGHPVLVFSHGSNLYGGSSSYLMRHFASHGWMVVAPTHVGNTMTEFGSGDCESDSASCRPLAVWYQRPQNTMVALSALGEHPDLGATANTQDVVLAGFSYGAFDTWARIGAAIERETIERTCEAGGFDGGCTEPGIDALSMDFFDERIRAAIPIAGADDFPFGEQGRRDLSIPVMQMSGTADDDSPDWVWENSVGTPMHWVSIEQGCHQMFSLGGCPEIEAEAGFDMIEAYVFAFARHHLLEDTSSETMSLLDGTLRPWEEVSVQSR